MSRSALDSTASVFLRVLENRPITGIRQYRKRSAFVMKSPNASSLQTETQRTRTTSKTVLAADIGGTNARFMAWRYDFDGCVQSTFSWCCRTADYTTFDRCFERMMLELQLQHFDSACFAVAGVVENNRCTLTNLNWTIDGESIKARYDVLSIQVINDFEAVGYGIFELKPDEILTLHSATPISTAPIAVLGPGTGLGEAFLVWDKRLNRYVVYPTEGSHADFAPRGQLQHELSLWIEKEFNECEIEQVCSGPGMVRIYDFLRQRLKLDLPERTPAEISAEAISGTCICCKQTVGIFLEILGAEAANLGMKCLATGGVYIAGGIPLKIKPLLQQSGLVDAFLRPGAKFHGLRNSLPLYAVLNPDVGLLGSRFVATSLLISVESVITGQQN